MISIIFSFLVILITSYTIGRAGMGLLGFSQKNSKAYELYIISGLCIICLYAEIFSIFAGVSAVAFAGLVLLSAFARLYLWKSGDDSSRIIADLKEIKKGQWIVLAIFFLAVLLWTDLSPQHYDSYLYHGQAIHWIEEYGLVKGLGNLHFRLAYNSALMPLQALYSFAWMGRSLHCLNGFFTLLILTYSTLTIGGDDKKGIQISDVMKLGMMVYVLYDSFHMSSPNTDTMALLLVYFIIIKWQEYTEQGITGYEEYGLLCIFVVFATTIKLSVGIMVLFVIYPAYIMIKKKAVTAIIKHILAGLVILIPYLIRNALISGYIIYPYEMTALKSADWRMPESVLKSDRAEIVAWARGNKDISRISEPVWKWIAEWYGSINILWKLLFVLTVVALIYMLIRLVINRKSVKATEFNLLAVCVAGMVFWLLTAPLPRYGTIYVITLPCLALGSILCKRDICKRDLIIRLTSYAWLAASVLYLFIFGGYVKIKNISNVPLLLQGDYINYETDFEEVGDYQIAVPISGDQTGYEPFPSAPYANVSDRIELRGDSLKDGFRNKSK